MCVGCGQGGSLYCSACQDAVLLVKPPICPLCGRPYHMSTLCLSCRNRPLLIDGIRSVGMFEGALRKAIHGFKYNYMRDLAAPLGDMLVGFWKEQPLVVELIVPVPLHPRRHRSRGYNQAALLAAHMGQATGLPVALDVLRRVRHTVSQTNLNALERRRNVVGAFSCSDAVRDKRVLLIDDVCTTGATLEACSVALKQGGARSVCALTVARAAGISS
jgi:ComF family protein